VGWLRMGLAKFGTAHVVWVVSLDRTTSGRAAALPEGALVDPEAAAGLAPANASPPRTPASASARTPAARTSTSYPVNTGFG
jgi:hypothetical protein